MADFIGSNGGVRQWITLDIAGRSWYKGAFGSSCGLMYMNEG